METVKKKVRTESCKAEFGGYKSPVIKDLSGVATEALFIWLIIRFIQLVFSAKTVFFSHKKSVNSVFQPAYNSSRTAPDTATDACFAWHNVTILRPFTWLSALCKCG
jgi:hypothetical protein